MARQIIPRTEQGKYEHIPDGLREYTDKIARELLQKYPDIDFWDLEMMFQKQFTHSYMMEFLRETSEEI